MFFSNHQTYHVSNTSRFDWFKELMKDESQGGALNHMARLSRNVFPSTLFLKSTFLLILRFSNRGASAMLLLETSRYPEDKFRLSDIRPSYIFYFVRPEHKVAIRTPF